MDHKIRLEMPAKKEPHTAFGKRLFALRKTRGLTQVQLADALGTTQRVISYYETEAELPPSTAKMCIRDSPYPYESDGKSATAPSACASIRVLGTDVALEAGKARLRSLPVRRSMAPSYPYCRESTSPLKSAQARTQAALNRSLSTPVLLRCV